ncbi:MAG: hypothetical protein LH481_15050 [Burkholderiales bacterium]|nr:hypothetical protein [Burkholderiales bacterium]
MTIKLFFTKIALSAGAISGSRRILRVGLLLTVLASGCAVQETPKSPVAVLPQVIVPKPVALTAEADTALQAAEQGVIEARVKRALWTAAVNELNRARTAAKEFNSAATLRHAREVIALCELSIAQLSRPPVKW